MKVTLRYSAYIPSANNNWIAYSLPSAALKQSPASQQTGERSSSQWRTLQLDSWVNAQRGMVPANNHVSNAASLITAINLTC